MLRFLARPATRMMERYLPDAFIFVIVLTLVAGLAAVLTQPVTPMQVIVTWGDGFWRLLEFAMQMLLVLVSGYIMATTPVVRRLLDRLAGLAASPAGAIVLVSLVSLVASWINWGFGLVVGALFAKALARRVRVDYRLLIASAYSGFVIWHGGLSGSIPLTVSTPGHFTEEVIGLIPTSLTTFASYNLMICAALFVAIPLVNYLMMPRPDETVLVDPAKLTEEDPHAEPARTPAEALERSPILLWAVAVPGLIWLAQHFITKGAVLNLNVVNFLFLFTGIALHRSPRSLLAALDEGVRGGAGIVIQFPFYAGIMAIMTQTGLAAALSEWFVSFSTAQTLPFWSFISAGIVNIFVPSGGGQWAVQAPVVEAAAQALQADMPRVVMAVAWGDAWTNLLQPFWALPMLGIAGLKPRDIMGFCLIQLVVTGTIIGLGLLYL
ncbi:short-chain fatty acid transporter [Paracoccus sanguinis]|uniref:Short-chain fatty acid transporter n=1 Tax=Paracoccus sanguinis TaxID=1545044 RepID=A0A099GJM4_9RHOB|nr:short-chain fatty acid transporter [Paracoccus sanguinis]KGJ22979.1 short-chain fatty acid transporter [Paracoccus sanguinis]